MRQKKRAKVRYSQTTRLKAPTMVAMLSITGSGCETRRVVLSQEQSNSLFAESACTARHDTIE
jgi:hypothetical protein